MKLINKMKKFSLISINEKKRTDGKKKILYSKIRVKTKKNKEKKYEFKRIVKLG